MHTEPNLTRDQITVWLKAQYDLTPTQLDFIPHGECAWLYRVTTPDKGLYLLRLEQAGVCEDVYTPVTIKMLQALYYDFSVTQMPKPPLRARSGQHLNKLGEYTAVIVEYLDGTSAVETPLNETLLKRLGSLLAKLHQCKLNPEEKPAQEDFFKQTAVTWVKLSQELDRLNDKRTPMQHNAVEFLKAHRENIKRLYEPFIDLQKKHRANADLKKRFVLTHYDPTNGNIIVRPNGQVYLIDWGGAKMAPAERDLVFWRYKPQVLEGYTSVTPSFTPDEEVYRFYQLAWDISEVCEYGTRLLFKTHPSPQQQHDYDALKTHLEGLNAPQKQDTAAPAPVASLVKMSAPTPVPVVLPNHDMPLLPGETVEDTFQSVNPLLDRLKPLDDDLEDTKENLAIRDIDMLGETEKKEE